MSLKTVSQPGHFLWVTGTIFLLWLNNSSCTLAQIIPDATLPNNTITIPEGNAIRIEGGTQVGGNLFHSFTEFSIPINTEALFNNALDTQNIFSRITGSNLSHIDGLIRANGTANLFFINPNGITFGSNAKLNIGGSFLASTANSIQFSNGTEFSATKPSAPPLLMINVPIGLQFNASNAGVIRIQGSGHNFRFGQTGGLEPNTKTEGLAVQPGKTLALVGGEIALEGGNLKAESGAIELWSVTRGSLPMQVSSEQINFNNEQQLAELGSINLSGAASVDSSGAQGGSFQIQSRNLKLEQGSLIVSLTEGSQPGRSATINVLDTIELIGRTADGRIGSGFFVQTNGEGKGGNLTITTDRLLLRDGASIGMGTNASGNSGTLRVQARNLHLGGLSANGSRLTGIFSNPTFASTGVGGDVIIDAKQLSLENGAVISVSTFGAGQSGNITVRANDVQIRGTSATGGIGSGFYARTSLSNIASSPPPLTGNSGNVTVIANRLSFRERATINVANFGKGNAGNINIRAAIVELDNNSIIRATQRQAEQGNITIESQDLRLWRNSLITTDASNIILFDTGQTIANNDISTNGGNIIINTKTLVALENSDITANAQQSFGGQVRINASGIFKTSNSDITATSSRGTQFSGIVQINTADVNPSSGLVALPENFTDISKQISQGCLASRGNSFVVTGRGGLPADPNETLLGSTVWRDLRLPRGNTSLPVPVSKTASARTPIVEATGWVKNSNGEVELVSKSINGVAQSSWDEIASCSVSK
ncbi:filamentous hemagglutinin N-terminal domain-containing protein [Coleofasciculus sp. FACHB-SPT9]|uniref:two-partner secretion domain-containing protein n=1 Tax=Trichocoleus sp. ST-U2 TaxID=2933929 RepID=UPI0019BF9EF8|nr:filamentous hemagglutinin N-terminal domain-containing protein [Coleofasciculus sp. FACHB-SPT9]MBD1887772.1 filamentous hemagglutinin N-terminal domain-containing protein [Coleofasciculus sp. FACHB-SPT9]